jgi:aspartate carbamoyltransferase catalytic subunit
MVESVISHDPARSSAGVFFDPRPLTTPTERRFQRRHLLGLEGQPASRLEAWLDRAAAWRDRWRDSREPVAVLRGVEVCNAFFEDSTRTRTSFELAARRLGATVVSFGVAGSSVSKGETLLDTLRTLVAMGIDVVVMRHASAGAAAFLAHELDVSVVNAGDGAHEHPTQGLLDLLTLRDAWGGRFEGRRLVVVGDIAHSRVARSIVHGLQTLGADVTVTGPPTLMPHGVETLGCSVSGSLDAALSGADGVMALRLQNERMGQSRLPSQGEYARVWGVTAERVSRMRPGAVVLHPGPLNRDVEIASDVADGTRSVVLDQVANGVAVRAAVLEWCAAREAA